VTQEQPGGATNYGGIGHAIAKRISEVTGAETRVMVLGHLQRGGMPTPRDRLMASIFGVHAVDLIAADRFNRMVGWSGRQVIDVPIEEGIAAYQDVAVDGPLVHTARGLGICFGDE
jgi:6-phosphofructokinase 1